VCSSSLLLTIAGLSGLSSLFLALRPHDSALRRHEVGQVNAIVIFVFIRVVTQMGDHPAAQPSTPARPPALR